jgi:DNA polymerase III delta prime subunit
MTEEIAPSPRMQSYKDAKDKDSINWGELHFLAIDRMARAKMGKDHEAFIDSVDALELLLIGFKDHDYDKEMRRAEVMMQKQISKVGHQRATLNYYDAKARAISSLVARVRTSKPKVLEYVGQDRITQEIAYKLLNGVGQNLFITGKTGSGKSYSAIALAKAVTSITASEHPNAEFSVKKHIAFTPHEFIRIYNDENLTPPGSAIIFDEAGVTLAARDAATRGNKIFSKLMQIIRHRRIFVIMTAPDLGFIDKSARKMLHWWLETHKIDRTLERCHVKPHVIEVNQREGDILYPYPRFDGQQIGELVIDKIDAATAAEYEAVAAAYKNQVAAMTESSLIQEQANNKDYNPLRDEFVKLRQNGLTVFESMKKVGISSATAAKYNRFYKILSEKI